MKNLKSLLSSDPISGDLGLLIIRLGIGGSMLCFHGWGKITGGSDAWAKIGSNMQTLGIDFIPAFWGFMASFAEVIGSMLIILGILFRPATFLLAFTMFIGALRHLNLPPETAGAGWRGASHALELFVIYAALFFTGPGKHSLSAWLFKSK